MINEETWEAVRDKIQQLKGEGFKIEADMGYDSHSIRVKGGAGPIDIAPGGADDKEYTITMPPALGDSMNTFMTHHFGPTPNTGRCRRIWVVPDLDAVVLVLERYARVKAGGASLAGVSAESR